MTLNCVKKIFSKLLIFFEIIMSVSYLLLKVTESPCTYIIFYYRTAV